MQLISTNKYFYLPCLGFYIIKHCNQNMRDMVLISLRRPYSITLEDYLQFLKTKHSPVNLLTMVNLLFHDFSGMTPCYQN